MWRRGAQRACSILSRAVSTFCEAPAASAARLAGPLLPPAALEAACRPAAAAGLPMPGLPFASMPLVWQQPASLSATAAAAAVQQAATGALRAPPAGGLLRQLEQMWADSVRRKRKKKMNKHKHRKRRKLNRMSSR